DLPKKCIDFATALRDTALAYPNLPNSLVQRLESEMFRPENRPLLLAGVASAAALGTPIAIVLGSWRASVVTNPFSKDWNDWFDDIEHSLSAPPSAAMIPIRSGRGTWESVVLGVLNILLAQSCSPEDLFTVHARLLQVQSASPWFSELGEVIARI